MQEVIASLAAAKDISTDAGVTAVLSKMGAVFTLKEKKKNSTGRQVMVGNMSLI